jgi:hypothetical protein
MGGNYQIFHLSARRLALILLICLLSATVASAAKTPSPTVRISAWYWLNSAPKEQWKSDFARMKQMGFTDVLICWGVDISAVATRKADTRQALQWANEAGIGVYLLIWHPNANSLPRNPKFMQVSSTGQQLDSFDVFNPAWRSTQWKNYLSDVVRTYHDEPALRGYAFDDSFDGPAYSYGDYEKHAFGEPLPTRPGEPRWDEWVKIRQGWWEDWAKDTVSYIRAADPDMSHEIYIEDIVSSIADPKLAASHGLDFARVAKHFDSVGGYDEPGWTDASDSNAQVAKATSNDIDSIRSIVGPDKNITYTFWCANAAEERKLGPAVHPTALEIKVVCQVALKKGIRHLDMYGYRIGDYEVGNQDPTKVVPPEPSPYELTGQFPRKFLWDRLNIQKELGIYLRGLNSQK